MEVSIRDKKIIVKHKVSVLASVLSSCSLDNVDHRLNLIYSGAGFDDNGRGISFWDESCEFNKDEIELYTPIEEVILSKEELLKEVEEFEKQMKHLR